MKALGGILRRLYRLLYRWHGRMVRRHLVRADHHQRRQEHYRGKR